MMTSRFAQWNRRIRHFQCFTQFWEERIFSLWKALHGPFENGDASRALTVDNDVARPPADRMVRPGRGAFRRTVSKAGSKL